MFLFRPVTTNERPRSKFIICKYTAVYNWLARLPLCVNHNGNVAHTHTHTYIEFAFHISVNVVTFGSWFSKAATYKYVHSLYGCVAILVSVNGKFLDPDLSLVDVPAIPYRHRGQSSFQCPLICYSKVSEQLGNTLLCKQLSHQWY